MTKKIFKGIIVVSIASLIFGLVLISGFLYDYFGTRLRFELKSEASYVSQGIEKSGASYFEGFDTSHNRITWIDSDGTVLYDSKADPATMENHANREEIMEAIDNGTGEATRYSDTLGVKTIYYALRMDDGTIIRVASAQQTVWVLLLGIVQPVIVILVFAFVLSWILASRVSKRIIRPINEIDLNHPDIDERYHELSPLLRNISNQNKLIEKQMDDLRSKQEEFSMITENMSEGFLIVDNKTDVLSYNSSALKLLGAEGDFDNKSVLILNRSSNFRKAVELALQGHHNEESLQVQDKFYHLISNPVYSGSEITGAVIIIIDVTEKEQRDVLRREFTSNVSHELKTPLTTISGVAEIIMNGIVKQEDIPKFARNIHDEAGRLITLIDDIINLSQLDENSIPEEKMSVDLYEVAKKVMNRLGAPASIKKISVELIGEHAKVLGIPNILEEMVYNLFDNAIKYNKENGKIKVHVWEEKDASLITVEDTGIGIPKNDLSRVFERFYRVDKSHSKQIGGTGLGLSIVKHGALYHNAEVKIDSTEGEGTIVSIRFRHG